jgi:hypothetical protein
MRTASLPYTTGVSFIGRAIMNLFLIHICDAKDTAFFQTKALNNKWPHEMPQLSCVASLRDARGLAEGFSTGLPSPTGWNE